jgi:CheY-like chemotaxis protein
VKPLWNSLTPESRDANNGLEMQTTDVLVLEKDYASRATLCDVLLGAGLSVTCARSEVEALEHLTTNTFRVALLDPSFPSRHGIQALRQRMKEMTPPGVVVITGTDTPELVLDALKTQAYDFVSTPIQADHLREVIQRALAADAALASFEVLCAGRKCVELSIPCARDAAERLEHFLNALEQDLEVGLQEAIRFAWCVSAGAECSYIALPIPAWVFDSTISRTQRSDTKRTTRSPTCRSERRNGCEWVASDW